MRRVVGTGLAMVAARGGGGQPGGGAVRVGRVWVRAALR